MSWHNKLKFLLVALTLGSAIIFMNFFPAESISQFSENDGRIGSPPSIQMYYAIEKYSTEHGVPKRIAYNVAAHETGYRGPFDWGYDPELESSAGAVGPMQIMPSTGRAIGGSKITKDELKTNIDLNVKISMTLLAKLHKQYGTWDVALGYYNTGYPVVNDYARSIVKNPIKIKTSL